MKYLFLFSILFFSLFNDSIAQIKPTQLTCEYLTNPSVVDVAQPRLSWINIAEPGERGQTQTAWQVRVATSKKRLQNPDLWDSGKTESMQSSRINYKGKTLNSEQECWWQVRVWDKNNTVSEWSKPAFWRMGLLKPTDWQADWIGAPWQGEETLPVPDDRKVRMPRKLPPPAPMFRKNFTIEKEIEKAVVFVTGLGYFELYLNGRKVGDDVLVPNFTNYSKRPGLLERFIPVDDNFREYRVMYLAYDVKSRLKKGENAIGSIIGNGFYNPGSVWTEGYGTPRFIAQLHITYSDGTDEVIVSDKSWKAAKSPILMDMVYYGEMYDARLEQPGWCSPGFDDSAWKNVAMRKAPTGKLVAQTAQPDKVTERLKPIRIEKMYNGNYKVDFGVEVSGWVKLSNVEAPAGHKIEINYLSNNFFTINLAAHDNTKTNHGR